MMSKIPGRKRFRALKSPEACLAMFLVAVICYVLVQWQQPGEDDRWNIPLKGEEKAVDETKTPARKNSRIHMPATDSAVRFLSYNVCNYFVEGEPRRSTFEIKPKKEDSRQAVSAGIASVEPSFVGLCEVGGRKALADLQKQLGGRGLDFPYSLVLERPGEDRALAFLSKYPIERDDSKRDVPLQQGSRQMLRGILDVTVVLPDARKFRFVGVHFKSKKDDDASSENMRRMEAYALMEYLKATRSDIPLVVYGDFNDGPDSPVVQTVIGPKRGDQAMRRLTPRDSRRESWTLYFARGQAYFSYDHLILNQAMSKRLGRSPQGGIVDDVDFLDASDHRPVWLEIR